MRNHYQVCKKSYNKSLTKDYKLKALNEKLKIRKISKQNHMNKKNIIIRLKKKEEFNIQFNLKNMSITSI